MYKGSCLCGTVQYEVRGEFGAGFFCHCKRCRKASGSAFGANVMAAAKDFVVTAGQASFKSYKADTGLKRYFCAECGSPIMSVRDSLPDVIRVRLGTLDTPGPAPGAHIYVGSKAEWDVIRDGLPQHLERPSK